MDSNFEGNNMEQWQQVENSPFDEMEELPIPASETIEEPGQQGCDEECNLDGDAEEISEENGEENAADAVNVEEAGKTKEELAEDRKRAEHEAAEAKRKAEWDAKQQEKRDAEFAEIYRLDCMPDEDVMAASIQRISKETERLTRRNMKDCVSEHIQTVCLENASFARFTMYPNKSMINCFRYINRKAREYIEQEMKDNDIKPENGVYGGDVPDDLCYQWAEEYFMDPDAPEDQTEKEEKFVPKPYQGKSVSTTNKNRANKKATANKPAVKKESVKPVTNNAEKKETKAEESESLAGQMNLMDYLMPDQNMIQKAS